MSIISPAYISIKIFLLLSATFYVGYMYGSARKLMNDEDAK